MEKLETRGLYLPAQPKPRDFIVLTGLNCSGKGEQGKKLKAVLPDIAEFSISNYMREALAGVPGREKYLSKAQRLKALMDQGIFFPDPEVIPFANEIVAELTARGHNRFLLDGYPRNDAQEADFVETYANDREHWIYYVIPDEVSLDRTDSRFHAAKQKFEETGDPNDKPRSDDKPEVARERVATFHDVIEPMIWRAEKRGNVTRIDASTRTIDAIHAETREVLTRRGIVFAAA